MKESFSKALQILAVFIVCFLVCSIIAVYYHWSIEVPIETRAVVIGATIGSGIVANLILAAMQDILDD